MITRTGIGTLASGGGTVAAVVCLLVGLQLLLLGAEIHSLMESAPGSVNSSAAAWKNLIQVSGWLSILAAGLVLFLVVSDRQCWRRSRSGDSLIELSSGDELEDVSVRIFEVDASNRMIEVTESHNGPTGSQGPVARPQVNKTILDSPEDDSATILDKIDDVIRSSAPPSANS